MWKEPVDIVILILASTVCLSLVGAMVRELIRPDSVDLDILGQVVLALIAIVSLYVGNKLKNKL